MARVRGGACILPAALLAACGGGAPAGGVPQDAQAEGAAAGAAEAQHDAGAGSRGVFADSVLFGQSAALTGPAQDLGRNMHLGIRAAFEEANRSGGIHGRLLKLRALDDGYEPERAIANTAELLGQGVFAMIGAVGTPTSNAAEPMTSDAEVPYIGPFTGAEFLREGRPWVVNVRASYYQETEEMVERLTTDLGIDRIAILYQDDSYGLAGLQGVRRAMASRSRRLVAEGTYVRNTSAVKSALLEISAADPQAVIIIGAYRPAAAFAKWARKTGLDAVLVNISFVGSNALLGELGREGEGTVVTQVVPFPRDASVPVVARYHAALEAAEPGAEPGFVSLEGYLAGLLTVEVLERAGREVTREGFVEVLRSEPFDLGGFESAFGPQDNQGSDRVFLTEIRGGRFVALDRLRR